MLVGVVFGKKLVYFIGGYIPSILPPLRWLVGQRFWMAGIILTCVFTAIYTWVPKKKLRMRDQIPGAIFSSVSWLAFSALFSLYLNHNSSFGIYGSLATIVIALLWMYYCMYILLLGTYLNVKRSH
jgi:membrane protein